MSDQLAVHEFTDQVLHENFDHRTVDRGIRYAHEGRVTVVQLGESDAIGLVRGSGAHSYEVQVGWWSDAGRVMISDWCECPIGEACKHAVALVVTLRGTTPGSGGATASGEWRRALADLHESDTDSAAPLALQVALTVPRPTSYDPHPTAQVTIRPLIQGAKGKWIKTGASWRDVLSRFDYSRRPADPDHRSALQAIAAASPYQEYSVPAAISLAQCNHGVWSGLRHALDVGIELVPERAGLGRVVLADHAATATVDLRADEHGDVTMSLDFLLGEHRLDTSGDVRTLGSPPHGLFSLEPGLLRLIPLVRALPRSLERLASGVVVPSADVDELLDVYPPLLARHATVGSSDGTVTIATTEFIGLVATVERPAVDRATLRWGARYRRGDRVTTHALHAPIRAGRDGAAELAAIADLELPPDAAGAISSEDAIDSADAAGSEVGAVAPGLVERLVDDSGRPVDLVVAGADAVRLLDRVVPWLIERDQVTVEVLDGPPPLREAVADPLVSLSIADPDTAAGSDTDAVRNDWFDLSVEVSVDGERIEFSRLFAALALEEEVLVLDSGTWMRLDRPELARLRELIAEARGLADAPAAGDTIRVNRFQSSWWDDLAALGVVDHQSQRWADSIAQLSTLTAPEPVPVPSGLDATLRSYQQEGLDWLAFLHSNRLGGVLADDMGLGKTIQTLALFLHVLDAAPDARFLVVAPTSVVENWHREAGRFAPGVEVCTIAETAKRRGTALADHVGDARIVVASYALFRIDIDEYRSMDWELLVLDEAQFVKNHRGKAYQCVRRLEARSKIAITGTPLENSLMDLWSLLSITAPGLYPDPARFSEVYRRPIESGSAPELLATLQRRIAPLMRRRTKDQVLAELPPKTEQVIEVELSPKHARLYQTQLQKERTKVLGLVDDVQQHRFEIFRSLTLLRQLSLDPGLVDADHDDIGSAKLDRLVEDLTQVVAEGHRALVFSQFTRFLGRVKARLDDAGVDYAYLDGRTRKREAAISKFKDGGAPVFVISLKAGGFGLNLTEADYCFVLDPWWNPAVETQAVDRTHRIGQTNPVMVYRYVSVGTIEEKVMELKARKSALFDSVMDADGALSGPLGEDDIRGLLGIG